MTDDTDARRIDLRAGPLTMVFEPEYAFLRQLRLGDREVLRGIYVAVRDRDWGTVVPAVSDVRLDRRADGFSLSFDVQAKQKEIDFFWHGAIEGAPDGTIRFAMDGEARSTFLRNRIGFCVLHPIRECAGQPCTVRQPDGGVVRGRFPDAISPHQPFTHIAEISYDVTDDVRAEISFEGDVFEMEDQRNWTDASFKTYCTPLTRPIPVEVKAGTRVRQVVALTLAGKVSDAAGVSDVTVRDSSEIELTVGAPRGAGMPAIGLGIASHGGELSPLEVERLRVLAPDHLRVDLDLSSPGYRQDLERAARQAEALHTAIEAAVFLSGDAEEELATVLDRVDTLRAPVARWLVFERGRPVAGERTIYLARRALSRFDDGVPVAAGTNAYFADLNRSRPTAGLVDGVCYSVNPQVHAFDDTTLIENLQGQGDTVRTARSFAGDGAVFVTPVTLRPRFNPDSTEPGAESGLSGSEAHLDVGGLPPQVDPRQASLLGAAWTLGSIKHLTEAGAGSITFFETTGWRGVLEREAGTPLPDRFPSRPGHAFPLYHVLADARELASGSVVSVESHRPLRVEGFGAVRRDRLHLLLANYTPDELTVRLRFETPPPKGRMRRLGPSELPRAAADPDAYRSEDMAVDLRDGIMLGPYEYVRIDTAEAQ